MAARWLKEQQCILFHQHRCWGKKLQQKGGNRNALNYSSNFLSLCPKHEKKAQTSPPVHTHHKGVTEAHCPLLGEVQVSLKGFEDESSVPVTELEHTNSKVEKKYLLFWGEKKKKETKRSTAHPNNGTLFTYLQHSWLLWGTLLKTLCILIQTCSVLLNGGVQQQDTQKHPKCIFQQSRIYTLGKMWEEIRGISIKQPQNVIQNSWKPHVQGQTHVCWHCNLRQTIIKNLHIPAVPSPRPAATRKALRTNWKRLTEPCSLQSILWGSRNWNRSFLQRTPSSSHTGTMTNTGTAEPRQKLPGGLTSPLCCGMNQCYSVGMYGDYYLTCTTCVQWCTAPLCRTFTQLLSH